MSGWLRHLPTEQAVPLAMVAAAALSAAGLLVFHRLVPHRLRSRQNDVAGSTMAIAGVVYAVLLAFIAVAVWQGYELADSLVQTEANLVDNLYRGTVGLPNSQAQDLRHTLFVYAETVVQDEWPALAVGSDEGTAGWQLLDRVHLALVQMPPQEIATESIRTDMLRLLNGLYDARRGRSNAASVTLPPVLWWNLLAGAALLLVFAYLFGPPSLGMHAAMVSLLGATIGLVLVLIVELTHPFEGDNHISPAAFNMLIRDVESGSYPHP
jgi:uncharacterized membrane protein YjfL (UPF0719 family)